MIKRLRIKFICINMTIVTAMLLVIFAMVFHFTQENLQQQSRRAMDLAQMPTPPGFPGAVPDKILLPGFVVEIGHSGDMVIQDSGFYDLSDETLVRKLVDQARNSEERMGKLSQYKLRYQVHAIPTGQRIVFVDISAEMETIQGLVKSCLVIGGASLLVFLGISILLAHWAVRPVEIAWNQQRQFVADASHELKTPLTVIMTNAELLHSEDYDEREKRQFSQNVLTMSQQMRGLVENLLELARVDNGAVKMSFGTVEFSALVEDCLMRFEPVYFEKNRFLEGAVEENLRIKGSQSYLQQAVDILLDNGVKYAPEGSSVKVSLRRQGNQCLLCVSNTGAPISKENLKNIFKRFYRVDKARSRDGSFGLGLSIAQSIVLEHRGKIWAESNDGVNTFCIQLNLLS